MVFSKLMLPLSCHILIRSVKARVLWNLVLSLFGVVLLWEKGGKRYGKQPLLLILDSLEENRRTFKNKERSIQRLKQAFLCSLWDGASFFLCFGHSSAIDFVDRVGSL